MSFENQKITDTEIDAAGVVSQPNKLTGTAAQNKSVFDALVKVLVKVRFNALIDELIGANAASQIGIDTVPGLEATTVQAALEEIMENIQIASVESLVDGSVTADKLGGLAVTEGKIDNLAVTEGKIADSAVTTNKIDNLAVTTAKIALLAITTGLLADLAVTTEKLDNGAVTTDKLAPFAVDNTKLARDAVTKNKIKDGEVTESKLAVDAVTTGKIKNGAVTDGKLSNNSVNTSNIKDRQITYEKLSMASSFYVASSDTIDLKTNANNSRAVLFAIGGSHYAIWSVTSNGSNDADAILMASDDVHGAMSSGNKISLGKTSAAQCLLFVLAGSVTQQ